MDHPSTPSPSGVVVAIDESSASRAALAWAADYARHTGSQLRVVHVLQYDFGAPLAWTPGLRGAPRTVTAAELDLARSQVQHMFDAVGPEPSWTLSFLEGPAGHKIIECARLATLLVIGTREHQGLERLLVGSVSHYCLTHAEGPIVAVPPARPLPASTPVHETAIPLPSGARS